MSDIYGDILRAQVKQGNLGGKSGPLGSLAKKRTPKSTGKALKPGHHWIRIKALHGIVYEATDNNGLSDPFLKIGRLNPDRFEGKYMFETPVDKKTLTPIWEYTSETFQMDINGKHKYLIVEMWDQDLLRNDFIGGYTIELSKFCFPERMSQNVTGDFTMYKDFDEKTGNGTACGNCTLQFSVCYDYAKAFTSNT